MIFRALAVWLAIAALAVLNGILRERVLVGAFGDRYARPLSVLMLCAIVVLTAIATITWITEQPARDRWRIGAVWVLLAVALDLQLAQIEHGRAMADALRAVTAGQLTIFVVTFIAPAAAAEVRGRAA